MDYHIKPSEWKQILLQLRTSRDIKSKNESKIETVARGKFFEPVLGALARKAAVYIKVHEDLRTNATPKWSKKDLVQRSQIRRFMEAIWYTSHTSKVGRS